MFTGIVAAVGNITSVQPLGSSTDAGVRLAIDAGDLSLKDLALGDSIALNGACMTVVAKSANGFTVDVSRASLRLTVGLDTVGNINLEKALTLADRLGGHLVSGHVDGLGTIRTFKPCGESWELIVEAPKMLAKYLACKGSIVVNGVALTINYVEDTVSGCGVSINLIPHTIKTTTLKDLKVDDKVNLEIDLIARYVERMLSTAHK